MTSTPVQHKSLLLPGYWRIINFGKLTENPRSAGPDIRIRTYLAQTDPSEIEHKSGRVDKSTLREMLLPIGELPRLHLNTILHDGQLMSHEISHLGFEKRIHRRLNCARTNIKVFERNSRDENGEYIIPVSKRWGDQLDDPERNGLFIAIGSGQDPYATIIPAIEIFRFFYATSDVLAKALLRDHFLDPDSYLWSLDKTAKSPEGHALLWLRKRMLDADARFLARFAFDEYALQQAQQIFLHAAAIGQSKGERTIRAIPPFQCTTNVQFYGTSLGDANSNRVLVTCLLRCDWKPPWTQLKWDRDNDGRYDPDKREERDPIIWGPNLVMTPDKEKPAPTSLSDEAPSTANIPSRLREEEITDRFPELANTPAEKMPQEGAKARSKLRNWRPILAEAYEGSVIDGQSSKECIGQTIVESLARSPAPIPEHTDAVDINAGQGDYLTVLKLLQAIKAEVEFMQVLNSITINHDTVFNVFPKELEGKRKSWLYIDQEKRHSRMVLVARLRSEGRTRYVIELQQRRPGECSTLVVWSHDELPVSNGYLARLVMDCARASGATLGGAEMLNVEWARLRHTTKEDGGASATHFFQRIFGAVQKED
ncbi:MAG: hypothetical protein P8014_05305 [Acidihalobacter sp.]|uniref:hypothetical protein n=1 Tax=Acidihalobacter sp. TaxID=1872108 RepID=UPI00307D46F9